MKKFDGEYNGRKIYRSNNLIFYNVTLIHYIKFFIFQVKEMNKYFKYGNQRKEYQNNMDYSINKF